MYFLLFVWTQGTLTQFYGLEQGNCLMIALQKIFQIAIFEEKLILEKTLLLAQQFCIAF
jgi:hypothetical protein